MNLLGTSRHISCMSTKRNLPPWIRHKIINQKKNKLKTPKTLSPTVTLQLVDHKYFTVALTRTKEAKGTRETLVALLRETPGTEYDQDRHIWLVPHEQRKNFVQNLKQHLPEVTVEDIPKEVLKILEQVRSRQKTQNREVRDISALPEKLASALMPFQMRGVR